VGLRGGLCGLVALLALAPAAAADRVIGPAGSLHSVSVESSNTVNALPGPGTKLVYKVLSNEEAVSSMVIPGTDEPTVDSEPTILLSPLTLRPVIVWTRNEGTEAEINYSFYNGTSWSPATALTQNDSLDRRPQIFWGHSGYLHIVWSGPATVDGPLMYEAVLDSKGVVIVPPAPIHTTSGIVVTTSTGALPTLGAADAIFAVDTSFKVTSRVTVQGGYDEPVPVNKRVDFMVPAGAVVESAKVEVVNGRLLLLVKAGSKMYYSYESPVSGWTPLRNVTLDATTDDRAAELLIVTMLESLGAP